MAKFWTLPPEVASSTFLEDVAFEDDLVDFFFFFFSTSSKGTSEGRGVPMPKILQKKDSAVIDLLDGLNEK